MQRLNRALESNGLAKFFQGQVGLGLEVLTNVLTVRREDLGLAAGAMMLWADIAQMTSLLDQLLDHALGNAKPTGDLVSGAFPLVVRIENSFTEIKRERSHAFKVTRC